MSGLATAIRLRRRELDGLALALAAEQASAQALLAEAEALSQRRSSERLLSAAGALPAEAWFAEGARRLAALAKDRAASEQVLADLRARTVQVRARLQLLDDAAAEKAKAGRRRLDAKTDAALDDRIGAGWARR